MNSRGKSIKTRESESEMTIQKITKLISKAKEAYKIMSISTMEHVGWDESPRDPNKIPLALENLRLKCLAPGGEIVVTVPIGYNAYLDKLLKELEKKGIETRTFFIPMHEQPVFLNMCLFKFKGESYPVAEELSRKEMYLPSSSGLMEGEIKKVVQGILNVILKHNTFREIFKMGVSC